jgi:hypothetical protein
MTPLLQTPHISPVSLTDAQSVFTGRFVFVWRQRYALRKLNAFLSKGSDSCAVSPASHIPFYLRAALKISTMHYRVRLRLNSLHIVAQAALVSAAPVEKVYK